MYVFADFTTSVLAPNFFDSETGLFEFFGFTASVAPPMSVTIPTVKQKAMILDFIIISLILFYDTTVNSGRFRPRRLKINAL